MKISNIVRKKYLGMVEWVDTDVAVVCGCLICREVPHEWTRRRVLEVLLVKKNMKIRYPPHIILELPLLESGLRLVRYYNFRPILKLSDGSEVEFNPLSLTCVHVLSRRRNVLLYVAYHECGSERLLILRMRGGKYVISRLVDQW